MSEEQVKNKDLITLEVRKQEESEQEKNKKTLLYGEKSKQKQVKWIRVDGWGLKDTEEGLNEQPQSIKRRV